MKNTLGITLVELLIALAIFATVFALSSQGIVSSLKGQNLHEATTSTQSKLRRVNEVITQQLRGSVFGGIANTPYVTSSDSISFLLMNGAGGFQVLKHDSGGNKSFENAANLQIVSTVDDVDDLDLENKQAMMINANGDAVVFNIGNITKNGGAYKIRVVHPGCGNSIPYTDNTLLFGIKSVGLDYDSSTKIISRRTDTGASIPLAYDISHFQIDYVYTESDGTPHVLTAPITQNSVPLKIGQIDSKNVVLARLQITIEAEQSAGSRTVTRSYTSQVELTDTSEDSRLRTINGVIVCD